MKEILIFLVLAGLIVLIAILSQKSIELAPEKNTSKEVKVNLTTNKESYKQGERIFLNVSVFSQGQLENVTIVVSGIETRFGRNYINLEENTDLNQGENLIKFSFTMPYCSTCSGVSAGKHEILVKVIYGNETIGSSSKIIEIK